jgi:hypothetical protein
MENDISKMSDHDLLITMHEQIKGIKVDIKDLKDGTSKRIDDLEQDKANREDLEVLQNKINNDLEVRTRKLENKTSNYTLTLTLYSIAVGTMIGLIIFHILQK